MPRNIIEIAEEANFICSICLRIEQHDHEMENKWIGVDFDGTTAKKVDLSHNLYRTGEPIPLMVDRIRYWLAQGYEVRFFTARMAPHAPDGKPIDLEKMSTLLKLWSKEYIGQELESTCMKDPNMEIFWDDRAVGVLANTGIPMTEIE